MTALNLETNRFFLRPMEESDHADLLKVFGDAETMVFYPEPYTSKMVEKLIRRNRNLLTAVYAIGREMVEEI